MRTQDVLGDSDPRQPYRRCGKELDSLLLDGLNSGDPLPADEECWSSLRRDALAVLRAGE